MSPLWLALIVISAILLTAGFVLTIGEIVGFDVDGFVGYVLISLAAVLVLGVVLIYHVDADSQGPSTAATHVQSANLF